MFEVKGDLWTLPAKIICITTNGFVKSNGQAVMGRGCAKEAADRYPDLPERLAYNIKTYGNVLSVLNIYGDKTFLSFPVKHNWWEEADTNLITSSALELAEWINEGSILRTDFVALPRPGCGNGKLEWADVKPLIKDILPDNVGVVFK